MLFDLIVPDPRLRKLVDNSCLKRYAKTLGDFAQLTRLQVVSTVGSTAHHIISGSAPQGVITRTPGDGVSGEQVREELGDIAQLVGLQPVYEAVLAAEAVLEHLLVLPLDVAEALRQQAIVPARTGVGRKGSGHPGFR